MTYCRQVRPVRVAVEAQRRDGDEKSVKRMRGVRYTVLKNPGKLTDRRSEASGEPAGHGPQGPALTVHDGSGNPSGRCPNDRPTRPGPNWTAGCSGRPTAASPRSSNSPEDPPSWPDILRTIELGYSNARLEASDNRIKVTIRMAYGFHHANNPIALVMLRRGGLDIRPPQPRTQPTKTAEASYVLDISAQRGRCNRSITV